MKEGVTLCHMIYTIAFLIGGGISVFVSIFMITKKLGKKSVRIGLFVVAAILFTFSFANFMQYKNDVKEYEIQKCKMEVRELIKDDFDNRADLEAEIGATFDGITDVEDAKNIVEHFKIQNYERKSNYAYWNSGVTTKNGVFYTREQLYNMVDKECGVQYFRLFQRAGIFTPLQQAQFKEKLESCKNKMHKEVDDVIEQRGITQKRIMKEKFGLE